MPLRPRVAQTSAGMHPTTRRYPLTAGEVPEAGDIVHLNASKKVIRTVAADPTPLLGLAEEPADGVVFPGFILVTVFTNDVVLEMEGNRAPLATDVNSSYGISRDVDGVWTVDTTETINTRVFVTSVDLERGKFLVKVLEAHRQSPE